MLRKTQLIPALLLATSLPTHAQAQQSGSLLDLARGMTQEIRSGKFEGDFIVRAQGKISDEMKGLPNLISMQTVGRARHNKGAAPDKFQHVDKLGLEIMLSSKPSGELIENRMIHSIELDAAHKWTSHTPGDLDVRFESLPGLQMTGVYASAMNIPFVGLNPPEETSTPDPILVAKCPKGARFFTFDTAPETFIDFKDEARTGVSSATQNGKLLGKGSACFDGETAAIHYLIVDGYGFKGGAATQYLREEIEFGDRIIDKTDDHFWLPKTSIVAMGPGVNDYWVNATVYESYKLFKVDVSLSFDGAPEEVKQEPETGSKKPTGDQPQK